MDTTTRTDLHVTITNPDDPHGMPIYDGALTNAAERIVPGKYAATAFTATGRELAGTVTVYESAAPVFAL